NVVHRLIQKSVGLVSYTPMVAVRPCDFDIAGHRRTAPLRVPHEARAAEVMPTAGLSRALICYFSERLLPNCFAYESRYSAVAKARSKSFAPPPSIEA